MDKKVDISDDFEQIFRQNICQIYLLFPPILAFLSRCGSSRRNKWSFSVSLFNEFLSRSPLIELLAKSVLQNKEEITIFSPKNDEIGFEKYLKRTIWSLQISDAFEFQTQKISSVFSLNLSKI